MERYQRVLFVNADNSFYKLRRYKIGEYFGPVDLGLHLTNTYGTLNIGTGIFAGSIIPGSNRLMVCGQSPCWRGFYISSMGGAGVVFDNLGINMIAINGKAPVPSVLYLNRIHGEEIEVEIEPIPELKNVWNSGRLGIYSLTDYVYDKYKERYDNDPRILVTGPAAETTDCAGICSVPITKGEITYVDTWAGRGGFGSKMLQEHGIVAVIYGGTFIDEDFRDRKVADKWFMDKYNQKLVIKDFESTTKYRYEPKANTGGTFGVNYATIAGKIIAFNYRTIHWTEEERKELHKKFILDHYLKQFNEETIETKQQKTCGEPCSAVCKKMRGEYKKDYEPYQTMGPLCGIFDQRAAELLNHHADAMGFDAISIGGVLAWLMECLDLKIFTPEELGVTRLPNFDHKNFDVVKDSMNNAELGVELIDSIILKRGLVDFSDGARRFGRITSRLKGRPILDLLVYTAFGRMGWMVPNQYWTAGVLSPMAIMGKYYMYYGYDFVPPRQLGRMNAERMKKELLMDNMGVCRFHRGWAEEMMPQIIESLYGVSNEFKANIDKTASRITSRNASIVWKAEKNLDYVYTFLKRCRDVDGNKSEELQYWITEFEKDKKEAGINFWYEIHKGIHETLRDF